MAQTSNRHLQNLSSTSLVAVSSMERANDVILLELSEITFKIEPVFRQIKIGDGPRLVFQDSLGQPFASDAAIWLAGLWSVVFPPSVKTCNPPVLERNRAFDGVLEFANVAGPIVRLEIAHCFFRDLQRWPAGRCAVFLHKV